MKKNNLFSKTKHTTSSTKNFPWEEKTTPLTKKWFNHCKYNQEKRS